MVRRLENKFTGTGEVKGFEFIKVASNNTGYIYKVNNSYYEVFCKKISPVCLDFENKIFSENEFKEIYPKSNKFGVSAWATRNFYSALNKLSNL